MHGAVEAYDALYKSLPWVMPLEQRPAGTHIMGYRALREASSHASQLFSALLWRASPVN